VQRKGQRVTTLEPPDPQDTRARDRLMSQWTEGLTLGLRENAQATEEEARVASITAKVAAARAALATIGPQADPAVVAALRALTEALEELIGGA
jgi:hypothetical protein